MFPNIVRIAVVLPTAIFGIAAMSFGQEKSNVSPANASPPLNGRTLFPFVTNYSGFDTGISFQKDPHPFISFHNGWISRPVQQPGEHQARVSVAVIGPTEVSRDQIVKWAVAADSVEIDAGKVEAIEVLSVPDYDRVDAIVKDEVYAVIFHHR